MIGAALVPYEVYFYSSGAIEQAGTYASRGVCSRSRDQQLILPDPIALDTSFVVEALLATQPLHGACDAFLKRIFDSSVSVVISELLRIELAETAFAIAMKERWDRRWRAHRTDGRSRRRAARLLRDTSRAMTRFSHLSITSRYRSAT